MSADGALGLSLRVATESDLPEMARIHRAAYGAGHFLALLPESVLAEYYRLFLDGGSCAVVAEVPSETGGPATLAGFAVFGGNIESRIARFKREQRLAILRTALANPVTALRKAMLVLFGHRDAAGAHEAAPWLLLSIAVTGTTKGVGSVLLERMIRTAESDGQPLLGLYVRHSNLRAVNAYLRAGFRIVASVADQYYMEITLHPSHSTGTR